MPESWHHVPILGKDHSHPEFLSHSILSSQKPVLSIIQYHFTIQPASQLLFSYSTH